MFTGQKSGSNNLPSFENPPSGQCIISQSFAVMSSPTQQSSLTQTQPTDVSNSRDPNYHPGASAAGKCLWD